MSAYDEILAKRERGEIVVIDGGMGSELEARGAEMSDKAWAGIVNLTDPELVRAVHEDYVRAGADVIITNTFMSGLIQLTLAGVPERFEEANRNAVRAAKAARDAAADGHVAIAGSVCMTQYGAADRGEGSGPEATRKRLEFHERQIDVLVDEGVDFIALEMLVVPELAEPGLDAALATGLPVWAGFSFVDDEHAQRITELETVGRELVRSSVRPEIDTVAVMHTDVVDVSAVTTIVREAWDGPIAAYPHQGRWVPPSWSFADAPVEEFVERARGWIAQEGYSAIGGCCGIRPEHISALRDDLAA